MSTDSTIDRLIRILDAFDARTPNLPVAELAERAQLPLPTAYRWANRLIDHGLLRRHPDGEIGPGIRLWELASRAAPSNSLRNAALPVMHDIQAVLRQHSQLAVLDDGGVLILERLSAPDAVKNAAIVATRLPLFTTSLGLVLLAFSPKEVLTQIIEDSAHLLGTRVEQDTDSEVTAVTNPTESELRASLAIIRREGFASVAGMLDADTAGVAVPVQLGEAGPGPLVAALGVVIPSASMTVRSVVPLLQVSALTISRRMASAD